MNLITETRLVTPPLTGTWNEELHIGSYAIHFDLNDVREALAAIKFNGTESYWPAQWKLPIISRVALTKVVASQPSDVQVEVSKKGSSFKVILHSITLENEQLSIIKALNAEIFSRDTARLTLHANWCREEADKSEREKFLLSIIFSSKEAPQKAVAASNAITILKTAGFCLAGLSFEGVRIPYSDLSKIVLEKTNFKEAYLKGVNFTNAYLKGASWEGADVSDIELGQLPHLIHRSPVGQAALSANGKLCYSLCDEGLYRWDLPHGKLIITQYENGRQTSFALSHDGLYIYTNDSDGCINILDSQTLEGINYYEEDCSFEKLICSSDGKWLIGLSDTDEKSSLHIWEILAGPELKKSKVLQLQGKCQQLCSSKFSSLIAIVPESPVSSSVEIVSIPSGTKVSSLSASDLESKFGFADLTRKFGYKVYFSINDILFSQNHSLVFSVKLELSGLQQNRIYQWFWDSSLLHELYLGEGGEDINSLHILSGTQQLLFGIWKRFLSHIKLFDLRANKIASDFYDWNTGSRRYKMNLLKNTRAEETIGGIIANKIIIWKKQSIENGGIPFGLESVVDFVFSADNRFLLFAHSTRHLRTYEANTGSVVREKEFAAAHTYPFVERNGVCYFSIDGRYMFSQSTYDPDPEYLYEVEPSSNLTHLAYQLITQYKHTKVFEISNEQDQQIPPLSSHLVNFACSSSHLLRISEDNNQLVITNICNGHSLIPISLPTKDEAAWTYLAVTESLFPVGYIAVATQSKVFLYEVAGSEVQPIYEQGECKTFNSKIILLAFTCGYFVVKTTDGKICKMQVVDRTIMHISDGLPNSTCIAVAKDMPLLAECITGKSVHFWNIETGNKLAELSVTFQPLKLCFSPDGCFLAAWGYPHFLAVWDTSRLEEGEIRLLWRIPQNIEANSIRLDRVIGLTPENRELFNQLGAKARNQHN